MTAPLRWALHSFVYTQHMPVTSSWHLLAEDARDAGFDGIEVFLDDFTSDAETHRIGETFAERGVEVMGASYAAPLYDEAQRTAILEFAEERCARLASAGGSVLGLSTSGLDRAKTDEEFDVQAGMVAAIVALAATRGIAVAYHTYPHDADDDCREIRELTGRLSADVLRLGPDLGWLAYGGADPAAFVRTYGDRIDFVHLRDERDRIWPAAVGEGTIDWPAVVGELQAAGFDGWRCIELADTDGVAYPTPLRERHRRSREHLERLWAAGPGDAAA